MKSITIHNLDDPLDSLIRERAKQDGVSLNTTIKKLLREALGLSPAQEQDRAQVFQELCGVWSTEDAEEFYQNTSELGRVDSGDWV
ncbi:MAG: hypothetical protein BWK76_09050 [Desulfobulbaceae bacterium A2]|nr:MAG: hypothetical protein BWK76_09050 [Desulfobulbaceae bacterium A2]